MRKILLIVATTLLTLPAISSAHAANFYITQRLFGGVIIHVDGKIKMGDEQRFARIAFQYPPGTVVEPDGGGGVVGAGLDISDLIWKHGFDTMLNELRRLRFSLHVSLVKRTTRRDPA